MAVSLPNGDMQVKHDYKAKVQRNAADPVKTV